MSNKKEGAIFGRKGGMSTLEKHGVEHMSKIAKKRWRKVRKEKKAVELAEAK